MHIVITGASKGIGRAIAFKFARETKRALRLSVCARHAEELEQLRAELEGHSSMLQIFSAVCDVSNETEVALFAEEAQRRFGTVDILVNNAGFGIFRSVTEMTTKEFDSVLAVNLRGVFLVTRAVIGRMLTKRSGTVITISSIAGKNGFSGGAAYCAAKFGVRGLMQSLFLEVREHNIRVVTIFPGSVDTDFFDENRGSGTLQSPNALKAEDIADCVYAAASLPARADISELEIRPTNPKGI
jgi:NADP-dependent 3-hydroxy acid dehydrogenase YdfG